MTDHVRIAWGDDLPYRMRRTTFRRILWLMLGLFPQFALTASCSEERQHSGLHRAPVMQFEVDPTLLGPVVRDSTLRISFQPPLAFVPVDSVEHREIRDQIRQGRHGGDPLANDPVQLFEIPGTPARIKIGRFLEPPVGGMDNEWIERCREIMEQQVAPAEVLQDVFRIGETVLAVQFLVQSPQMILFRIICQGPGPEPVLIDYLLPRDLYELEVRAVESSIGTVEMF